MLRAGLSCPSAAFCVAAGYGSGRNSFVESTDGGAHWSEVALPAGVVDIHDVTCLLANECYAVGSNDAARSVVLALG